MKLVLERPYKLPKYTIGNLFINSNYFCDTLEDPIRDLNNDGDLDDVGESKIFGDTAILAGTYKVVLLKSPKFKRILPTLLNTPRFEGILIHRGNTPQDTHGCILVGKNEVKGQVVESKFYEEELIKILQAAVDAGETIEITIK